MKPSDPAAPGWGGLCTYLQDDWPCDVHDRTNIGCPPRASIQRWAANDIGCDFNEIAVVARWGRILSRQEVWDDLGCESWMSSRHIGYYFHKAGLNGKGNGAHYRDDEVAALGSDPFARDWSRITPVDIPTEPPADWKLDERLGVWAICGPKDPGATPIYVVEER